MKKKKIQIPIETPDGYFEALPDLILARVKELPQAEKTEGEGVLLKNKTFKIKTLWTLAGAVAATLLLFLSLWTLRPTPPATQNSFALEAHLAEIPTEAIAQYLAQDEELTALEVGVYFPEETQLYPSSQLSKDLNNSETIELLLEEDDY
ncbi:hypothetical protein [Hugenholtzia roseola]|uniref:hypothetical protein n=1 Tax=Hugenholtzia roseola TaxID=1002 RepID=UPI0004189C2E|nr:hypothetical protein [Hugenholtzia roseola]